ncbi:hypothetical protein [Nonomuraea sp. NPDC003804]|uniref:hypothetical protein n=1 Tax=Nonomuraea sp. NPDC003804 TaxID=3154547 RepID=UPI0033B836C4
MTQSSEPPAAETPNERIYANQTANTTFNGSVYLTNGAIGFGGPSSSVPAQRAAGRMPQQMIDAATRAYAPPPAHDHAVEALRKDRVIVLYGPQGSGKRAGAINVATSVDPGIPLVMPLPDQELGQLAERSYEKNIVYLVFGWSGDEAATDAGDASLALLTENVLKAGAYMIITSGDPISSPQSPAVPHFAWRPPAVEDVLRVNGATGAEQYHAQLRQHSLADVVQFARDVSSGRRPEDSLNDLDPKLWSDVQKWFGGDPSHREVLEVAALLFLEGLPEGRFEAKFAALVDRVLPPSPEEGAEAVPKGFTQSRKRSDDSLITTVKRVAEGENAIAGQFRRCVVFRKEGYRARVAAELCDRYPADFWKPLFAWLHEVVVQPDDLAMSELATGLALVARDDFDSVREQFLQPWSAGERGRRGWNAAVEVLWSMCLDESLAPLARQTAIRWARSREPLRQRAAALAFSSLVGVLYTGDALHYLWQLTEEETAGESASLAIVGLYQTLSWTDTGAHRFLLDDLGERLRRFSRPGTPRLARALRVAVMVLEAPGEDGMPLAVRHLRRGDRDVKLFARLWAAAMVNRPSRSTVFDTLYNVLDALDRLTPPPVELVESLYRDLADALPVREHAPFNRDFRRHATRRRSGTSPQRLFMILLPKIFPSEDW